jgi:hypothetical protein
VCDVKFQCSAISNVEEGSAKQRPGGLNRKQGSGHPRVDGFPLLVQPQALHMATWHTSLPCAFLYSTMVDWKHQSHNQGILSRGRIRTQERLYSLAGNPPHLTSVFVPWDPDTGLIPCSSCHPGKLKATTKDPAKHGGLPLKAPTRKVLMAEANGVTRRYLYRTF